MVNIFQTFKMQDCTPSYQNPVKRNTYLSNDFLEKWKSLPVLTEDLLKGLQACRNVKKNACRNFPQVSCIINALEYVSHILEMSN